MKKKVLRGLLPVVLAAAWLTGCGGEGDIGTQETQTPAADEAMSAEEDAAEADGEAASGGDFLVGFANNSDTYNYCAKFRSYLKEETEAKGIQIMVTDAAGDTNVQNGQVDDFIVQNAKVVSAISNDLDGSVPALEAAKTAGIPYISFLTQVSGGEDYEGYIYVGSPNVDAGKAQGDYLCEVLPENAQILYFTGEPNDQQYIDRKQGLTDALAARSDITIMDEYNAALGVVEALKSAGRLDGILVLGVDGSDDALTSVKNGEMAMTALQDARAQAQAGADIFEQLKNGKNPAEIEDVYVPFKIVSSENVDEYLQ